MPLETADTIAELNALWPLGSDPKSQGDDHLRLIKGVLQDDAISLANGGQMADFILGIAGASGDQIPIASDVPELAGTGPVTIIEGDVGDQWMVWGNTLIQWGSAQTPAGGQLTINYVQPYTGQAIPSTQCTAENGSGIIVDINQATTAGFQANTRLNSGALNASFFKWFAVGNAPDALKKPEIIQTAGGSELQIYHDPANAASWQILGNTLTVWGSTGSLTDGGVNVSLGGKAFANTNYRTTLTVALGAAPQAQEQYVGMIGSKNVGSFNAYNRYQTDNVAVVANVPMDYTCIGQWDGIS